MMVVKTEVEGFVRDVGSNALINTNAAAYQSYKERRKQHQEFSNLQRDVNSLKEDMGNIKDMLQILIQRDNNGPTNR